jgi:hypothetical protein
MRIKDLLVNRENIPVTIRIFFMEFFKWMHFSFVGLTLTLQGEKKIKK